MISEELLKDRIDIELCRFFRSKIDLQVAVRCPVGSVLVQHLGGRNSESVDHGGLFGEYVEFLRDHVLELDLLSEIAELPFSVLMETALESYRQRIALRDDHAVVEGEAVDAVERALHLKPVGLDGTEAHSLARDGDQ